MKSNRRYRINKLDLSDKQTEENMITSLTTLARQYLNYKYIVSEEEALAAIAKDWSLLRHVRFQTPQICIEAVKENPEAIGYVDPKIFEELKAEAPLEKKGKINPNISSTADDCYYFDPENNKFSE